MTLMDLCFATASVSLWALARVRPLTGYMGSKRRDAALLCALLGVEREPPSEVVLVDGGPWGDVHPGADRKCRPTLVGRRAMERVQPERLPGSYAARLWRG